MNFEQDRITFQQADLRYAELKEQRDAETISDEEFGERLRELMVLDDRGRWWAKSRETGGWHYNDGTVWVGATPPGYRSNHGNTTPPGGTTTDAGQTETPPSDDRVQHARPEDHVGTRSSPWPTPARNWRALALGGLMLAFMGFLGPVTAVVGSYSALVILYLLFDALGLAYGVFALIASRAADPRLLLRVQGVISILAGLAAFLSDATENFIIGGYITAFWAICLGILQLIAAIRLGQEFKAIRYMMISGTLLVVYSLILLTIVLGAISSIPWLTGACLLVSGISLVILAFRIRPQEDVKAEDG